MTHGRTPLLALALVVLAGLGAGAWFLLGAGDGHANGPVVVAGPEEPRSAPATGSPARPGAALELGATLDGPSSREPGRPSFVAGADPSDALWIAGRVLAPAGMPSDDTLAVVALGYPADVATRKRPAAAWSALEQKLEERVGRTRRAVEPDGSFRIPVDAAATTVYLYVDGRYAFLPEPVELALAAGAAGADVTAPRLEPELGAWLTGRITIPLAPRELAELEDASVGLAIIEADDTDSGFAFRFGGSPDRSARLDEEGRYSFRGLDPDALHDLAFRHDDYLPATRSKLSLAGGSHEVIDLAIDLGGRVAGRVLDEDGQPVADATVRQERGFMDFLGGGGRATSNADGLFVVKGLRPGEAAVKASRDGYVGSEPVKVTVAEGETVTGVTLVLPSGEAIAGRVVFPEGEPARNARVFCEPAGGQEDGFNFTRSVRSTQTDADGRFAIKGLDAEAYHLRASVSREKADPEVENERMLELEARIEEAGPFASALRDNLLANSDVGGGPRWTARVRDVDAGTDDVLMTLEPPTALRGVVRDETGAPVTVFAVEARPVRDALQFLPGSNEISTAFEDPGGAFVLEGLQPGLWRITAKADGYASTGEGLELQVPEDVESIEIVLSRASRVTGVVLDPTGAPVAAAEVQTGSRGGFRGTGRVERSKRRSTKTNAEGRFELEDVPAENTVIGATADGWAASDMLPIEPLPGGELIDLVLHLKLGGTLTGEVQGPEGPLGASRVRYNSMSALSTGAVTANADGTFRVEHLTPGLYQVMVEPDPETFMNLMQEGKEPDMSGVLEQLKMVSAEIHEGETTHVVLGEAPKNPVQVFGRLTEGGEPVSGRMVIAMAEGEQLMSSLRMDQTDEDGRFQLKLKAPGPVVFSVQLDGGTNPQFFEDVPEVETWEVDLALPTASISGTVFDPGGEPVRGVGVRISSQDGIASTVIDLSNRASTGSDGGFAFKNLAPGTYTVRAGGTSPFGGSDGSYGTQIVSDIRVDAGERRQGVEVRLARPGRIEGHVRTAAGGPAIGAAVFVRDAAGRLLSPFSGCATDASGRFSYEGVSPGSVTVSARLGVETSRESSLLIVRESAPTEVELQLEGGTMLLVSLESEGGEAQRAQVRVFDEDGREYTGMAAQEQIEEALTRGFSSREHRVGPLPEGRFKVVAITPDGAEHKKPVTLRGQDERKIRIRVD